MEHQVNDSVLRQFWKEVVQRMGKFESVVTVGMRGDGDEPMSEENNIALLEKIVADQRNIIQDVTGKNPAETPQYGLCIRRSGLLRQRYACAG